MSSWHDEILHPKKALKGRVQVTSSKDVHVVDLDNTGAVRNGDVGTVWGLRLGKRGVSYWVRFTNPQGNTFLAKLHESALQEVTT